MKNLFFMLLCLWAIDLSGQPLNLSGSLPHLAGKKIILKYLDHHKATIPVDAHGDFSLAITVEAGYYSLEGANILVYLEPGMSLSVSQIGNQILFAGKGSEENRLAKQVNQSAAEYFPLRGQYLTSQLSFTSPDNFLAKVIKYQSDALNKINKSSTSAFFKNSQAQIIKFRGQYLTGAYRLWYGVDTVKDMTAQTTLSEYFRSGRTDMVLWKRYLDQKKEAHVKFLSSVDSARLNVLYNFDANNQLAYQSSADYRALLDEYFIDLDNKLYAANPAIKGKELFDKVLADLITDSFITQEMNFQYVLNRFKLNRDKDAAYNNYVATATNPDYINDIKEIYLGTKSREGAPSADFEFTDVNGVKISLASMRGNYVYIDMWATYCISCMAQMPALKLLEKRYERKKIKFVGISVDAKKDETKWRKFVTTNKLEGTQLIAYGTNSDFHNFYKVSGIPRFILIDPNGIVVSEDALSPNDNELQKQLDQLLAVN